MTGGRIKRIQKYVGDETFMLTYGDAVSDVNIKELYEYHKKGGRLATLTATRIDQRFGILEIDNSGIVEAFREKSTEDGARINAGYMVLEPEVFDYLKDDKTVFEKEPLVRLVNEHQLNAYTHDGFWQCMDTKREMDKLEELWASGDAPWKKWED